MLLRDEPLAFGCAADSSAPAGERAPAGGDGVMELEPIEDFRRVRHTTGEEGGMQIEEVDEDITVKLFLKKAKPPYVRGWNYLVFGKMGDRYAGQLKELAEIVRGERPNPQELYDHDLRVHKLSLQACNISLAEEKNPAAVDAFESGGHRIVASDRELDVR